MTMDGPRTLIVVDDQTLFRQALAQMIEAEESFTVVAQGSSTTEAVELAARYRPDLALLDVEMPGPNVRDAIRQIAVVSPATRVAILTMHDEAETIQSLIGSGAYAYLAKNIAREHLIAALDSVYAQDTVQVSVSRDSMRAATGGEPPRSALTERELEVLRCVALALSNSQIGAELHITEGTVKRHLTNIFGKLDAVSRLDAVRKAQAARLLGMSDYGSAHSSRPPLSPPNDPPR